MPSTPEGVTTRSVVEHLDIAERRVAPGRGLIDLTAILKPQGWAAEAELDYRLREDLTLYAGTGVSRLRLHPNLEWQVAGGLRYRF